MIGDDAYFGCGSAGDEDGDVVGVGSGVCGEVFVVRADEGRFHVEEVEGRIECECP
jgi:hypothetical protein